MEDFEKKSLSELYRHYLASQDDADSEVVLGEILTRSLPKIDGFFKSKPKGDNYSESDAEDLSNETLLKLTMFLRSQRDSVLSVEIDNFEAYIFVVCRSVFADFWRKKFADHFNLQNRIRYLFKKQPRDFLFWVDEFKRSVCSAVKRNGKRSTLSNEAIREIVQDKFPTHQIESEFRLVDESLKQANGWIYFNDLVAIVSKLRGIKIAPRYENTNDETLDSYSKNTDNLEETHSNRAKLIFLWDAIRELERLQKLCLLFNLRDKQGREVNTIWFESKIATLKEIGEQFEVSESEMAELLIALPFSDVKIATVLCISERATDFVKNQKVSNLRKVARDNLKRRLEGKKKRKR